MKGLFRKTVVIGLIVLFLGSLGASIYLDDYFFRTRPRKPDLRSGRIYPQAIHHGALVYLTRTEALVFEYSWLAFPIFAVPAYLLNQRWKAFRDSVDVSSGPPKRKQLRPIVIALFGSWCLFIAGLTMSDRLFTEIEGAIVARDDVNGYNRPGTIYTLRDPSGNS